MPKAGLIIGGKQFVLWDGFRTKASADTEAKRVRGKGHLARVIKLGDESHARHPYAVYVRKAR